ncbi:MAG: hypothetical protein ACR2J8_07165, partial [Thermomicrobiales bacterium]
MDQQRFDAALKALGQGANRRQAMAGAIGALIGGGAMSALAKGKDQDQDRRRNRKRPAIEGPCGDGSRTANRCTRDGQCCTDVCNMKAAKKNQDGKGRCRCIQRGKACSADKNCCGTMTCSQGSCRGGGTAGGNAAGSKLQDDIDKAPPGAVIELPAGTYAKDLKVTKSLTLKGPAPKLGLERVAAAAEVVLMNATDGSRSLAVTGAGVVLSLENVTVTRNTATAVGGGIEATSGASVALQGATAVKNCVSQGNGGGLFIDGSTLTIDGTSLVTKNSAVNGGGVAIAGSGASLTMGGTAKITANNATGQGGGVWSAPGRTATDATVTTANVYENTAPTCNNSY